MSKVSHKFEIQSEHYAEFIPEQARLIAKVFFPQHNFVMITTPLYVEVIAENAEIMAEYRATLDAYI